jgi:hypothetical protein
MTIITLCIIASTVVNITAQTTINGVVFGPNVSVVTPCVTAPDDDQVVVIDDFETELNRAKQEALS